MLKRIDPTLCPLSQSNTQRLEFLQRLTHSARSRLPDEIKTHFWVTQFDETTISIITDNSSYIIYLRTHQYEILKQLNEEFFAETAYQWKKVSIKVSRENLSHN